MPPIRQNNTFLNTGGENNKELVPSNPFQTLGIIFLAVATVLSLISYGVLSFTQNKNTSIENNIKVIGDSLTNVPLSEMLVFYSKIKSINNVLKSHNYITTHLLTLSDAVEPSTYFKNYNFVSKDKGNSEITFSGVTTNEANIVRQIDIFKSDDYSKFIKSVELRSVSKDQFGNILFDLKLTVDSTVRPDYLTTNKNLKTNTVVKTSPQSISNLSTASGTKVEIKFEGTSPISQATSSVPTTTINNIKR